MFDELLNSDQDHSTMSFAIRLRVARILEDMADTESRLAWWLEQGDEAMVVLMRESLDKQKKTLSELRKGIIR